MTVTAMIIEKGDHVATCLSKVKKGDKVKLMHNGKTGKTIKSNSSIPYIHKICISPMTKGEHCMKYGLSIGIATKNIKIGDYIHVHNIESARGRGDLEA